jgi:hypothetical protein
LIAVIRIHWGAWGMGRGEWGVGNGACSIWLPYTLFSPPPGLPPLGGGTERDSLPPLTPGERSRKWCTQSLSLFGNVGSACRRRARCRYHSLTRQPRTCSRYGVRPPCCRINHAHRSQLWGSAPCSSRTPYFRPPPGLPPRWGEEPSAIPCPHSHRVRGVGSGVPHPYPYSGTLGARAAGAHGVGIIPSRASHARALGMECGSHAAASTTLIVPSSGDRLHVAPVHLISAPLLASPRWGEKPSAIPCPHSHQVRGVGSGVPHPYPYSGTLGARAAGAHGVGIIPSRASHARARGMECGSHAAASTTLIVPSSGDRLHVAPVHLISAPLLASPRWGEEPSAIPSIAARGRSRA